jgi:hypothetical protein
MSFDVFLFPSSASPIGAASDQQVVAASRSAGVVKPDISGGTSSDGVPFEIFGGGDGVSFALRDISPGLCKVIFQVALQTRSYIAWDGASRGRPVDCQIWVCRFVAWPRPATFA